MRLNFDEPLDSENSLSKHICLDKIDDIPNHVDGVKIVLLLHDIHLVKTIDPESRSPRNCYKSGLHAPRFVNVASNSEVTVNGVLGDI